jgi:hypothetical protein
LAGWAREEDGGQLLALLRRYAEPCSGQAQLTELHATANSAAAELLDAALLGALPACTYHYNSLRCRVLP